MSVRPVLLSVAVTLLGACTTAPAPTTDNAQSAVTVFGLRRPQGIYAHVELKNVVTTPGDWSEYLRCFYGWLLENDAVSGIEVSVGWDELAAKGRSETDVDWTNLQPVFDAVHTWNTGTASDGTLHVQKSIQLIVIPGFKSPAWLLHDPNLLPSCDEPLFGDGGTGPVPGADCGKITIDGYDEGGNKEKVWPLPWSPVYKTQWANFLGYLAAQYGGNTDLVSLAMGGPTGTSDEMFVPHYDAGDNHHHFGHQTQSYPLSDGSGDATPLTNHVMDRLIDNWAAYQRNNGGYHVTPHTDDVFVTEWSLTFQTYANLFPNITLIMTPAKGDNFPELGAVPVVPPPASNVYDALCVDKTMSCATTAEVMSAFQEAALSSETGVSGRGVQMSGVGTPVVRPGQPPESFGMNGVRWLASQPVIALSRQMIGGGQFTHAFSKQHGQQCTKPADGGVADEVDAQKSPSPTPVCSVEEAEYNVLGTALNETPAACFFQGETVEQQPLNYLQIFWEDFQYAGDNLDHPCLPTKKQPVLETPAGKVVSLQDLFEGASKMLNSVGVGQPRLACGQQLFSGTCEQGPSLSCN